MTSLLEVVNMNTYIMASHILFNANLRLNKGETISILGRNGAGKTTLLKSIAGFYVPVSGSIHLNGECVIGEMSEYSKSDYNPYFISLKGVSYVPEDRRIFQNLTVEENLNVSAKSELPKQVKALKEEILDLFPQLRDLRHKMGHTLSGGEMQMLAIGRALMGRPKILLLDEPSQGLSGKVVNLLMEAIQMLSRADVSVIMAEQNINFVKSVATRVYVLESGYIKFDGGVERFFADKELSHHLLAL